LRLIRFRRPSTALLREFVAGQAAKELSYSQVGATRWGLPPGYAEDKESADLGPFDPASFDRAAAALTS